MDFFCDSFKNILKRLKHFGGMSFQQGDRNLSGFIKKLHFVSIMNLSLEWHEGSIEWTNL